MGWYLQYILLHSDEIRDKGDVDSDEFNDLLTVEKAILAFVKNKSITGREYMILNMMRLYHSLNYVSGITGINRYILSKTYQSILCRLSMSLGGIFTDEGYLHYLQNKYNTSIQLEDLRQYAKTIL